jgi:5-methylcytosine-specific restriction endonuclease McrA
LGNPIPLELEHKDGNCTNHNIENLELLCPNCHALTDTYRGKNKGS